MQGHFKHSYKTKTRESLPMAIYNSGAQRCEPCYTWGPGLRDHFLIHHVISGKGSYTVSGKTYHLMSGDTFLIYPSDIVCYRADAQEPWEYCWVGFNGADARFLMGQTPFHRERLVVHFEDSNAIERAINAIWRSAGSSASAELRTIGSLYLFLSMLTELSGSSVNRNFSLEYVENAIRFISYNYSTPINISHIAAHVGVSRSHLYRVFMREIGTSPNEYLMRFRVSQACELISHTNLQVSAVAASVGYEDALYFSRVFKKMMGCSPSAYHKGGERSQLSFLK